MPRRKPIARSLRRPQFSPEALQLFIALEAMVDQDSHEYKVGSKRLAQFLNLGAEWLCSSVDVCMKELEPCWPPDHPACDDFWRVRKVRLQLLEAAKIYLATINGRAVTERDQRSSKTTAREPSASIDIPIVAMAAASRRDHD